MTGWAGWRHRLRSLFLSHRADRELQEELDYHLEQSARQLEATGVAPAEARRQAALRLGGRQEVREEVHDARGWRKLDDLRRDLVYAWRQIRRAPGFSAATVTTLALSIGAASAIWSVVTGVLLRPAPLADFDRLAVLWQTDRRTATTREPMSWPDYRDFRDRARLVVGMAAVSSAELSLVDGVGDPIRLTGVLTSANFLDLVGVRPVLGRTFTVEEAAARPFRVVLISEGLWERRFGKDPAVIGRSIRLDDGEVSVIGVLPAAAEFGLDQIHARAAYHAPYGGDGTVDVWAPIEGVMENSPRDTHPVIAIVRLAPGATVAQAGDEASTIGTELERSFPRSNTDRGIHLEPYSEVVFGPTRPALRLLVVASVLLLLVGTVNAANLLLARGAVRAREVAVRTALGAGAGRLGRQFVVESVVLAVLGGLAGVALAAGGLGVLLRLAPADLPRIGDVRVDGFAVAVSLGLALVMGIGFGLVPAWQARRVDPMVAMRAEDRSVAAGLGSFRRGLVIAELAISVTLVITAVLLVRSLSVIVATGPGYRTDQLLKAEYQLPAGRYPRDRQTFPRWPEVHRFSATLLAEASRLPWVSGAALASAHPLDAGFTNSFRIVGREAEAASWPEISVRTISPGYLTVVGLRVIEGRGFSEAETVDAPLVALINETAAKQFFPGQSALGQEIQWWGIARRIVGVVADERIHGVTEAVPPAVYATSLQLPLARVLVLRFTGDPGQVATATRAVFRRLDPALAVYGVEPLAATVMATVATHRFAMVVIGAFAFVAIALALIGIHGVLSFLTATRTREFGVRIALGASRSSVRALVLRDGFRIVAAGVMLGVVGAGLGSRLVRSFLFQVAPVDPWVYGGVVFSIAAVGLAAMWLPARRATRVEPIDALRIDG